jgi:hypothetical protein
MMEHEFFSALGEAGNLARAARYCNSADVTTKLSLLTVARALYLC